MFSFRSRRVKPPFSEAVDAHGKNSRALVLRDANGVAVAWLFCRDGSQRYAFEASMLTDDEARRIGKAIACIPEFMMQRQGFYPRGRGAPRWRADRPCHVAVKDDYLREHWAEMRALCELNSIPLNPTGEKIQSDGTWCVHEFAWQMDAILFWDNRLDYSTHQFVFHPLPLCLPRTSQRQSDS